jgi:Flp pilus assembly pilin Flp
MISFWKHFFKDQGGATMVEYCLLLVLIMLAAFAAVSLLGLNVASLFSSPALNSALGS